MPKIRQLRLSEMVFRKEVRVAEAQEKTKSTTAKKQTKTKKKEVVETVEEQVEEVADNEAVEEPAAKKTTGRKTK